MMLLQLIQQTLNTGETIIASSGYREENKTIQVAIKNQPFTSYKTSDGNYVNLCYNISVKPHYSDEWQYYPVMYSQIPLTATKDDYTVTAFGSNQIPYTTDSGEIKGNFYGFGLYLPDEGQFDFRVEALIGYYTSAPVFFGVPGGPYYEYTFFGESSGWSNIQTITINKDLTTTNSEPTTSEDNSNNYPQVPNQTQPLRAHIH